MRGLLYFIIGFAVGYSLASLAGQLYDLWVWRKG